MFRDELECLNHLDLNNDIETGGLDGFECQPELVICLEGKERISGQVRLRYLVLFIWFFEYLLEVPKHPISQRVSKNLTIGCCCSLIYSPKCTTALYHITILNSADTRPSRKTF